MLNLQLKPGFISLKELRQVSRSPVILSLDPEAIPAIDESTKVVEQVIAEDGTVTGSTLASVYWPTPVWPLKILEHCKKVSCYRMLRVSASLWQMKPSA